MADHLTALFIDRKFPWMGKHSGYDVLLDYLSKYSTLDCHRISGNSCPSVPVFDHVFAAYVTKVRKSLNYDRYGLWAELSAAILSRRQKTDLIHVLYVESHFLELPRLASKDTTLWATAHQPPRLWKTSRHDPGLLEGLDQLIVLSSESKVFFENFLPGRVHFIPHGVDVDFFSPGVRRLEKKEDFRCVFSGKWLRDLSVLESVISGVSKENPQIKFDLIVPVNDRNDASFLRIAEFDNVFWHAGLSDEQLRDVYRQASLLLLPLVDCTANNALLEGISCGLPVVSNDVGGLPDYTKENFAELLPIGDIDGMVYAVLAIVGDRKKREDQSRNARQFAVENLSWDVIAEQVVALYSRYCRG